MIADIEDLVDFESLNPQTSYSALTLHRKCPQAWYYRHSMKLEPDAESVTPYLMIGRWWSALRAVEALCRGRELESLVEMPRSISDKAEGYDLDPHTATWEDVIAQSEHRWRTLGRASQDEFVAALGETLPERLANMYRLWDAAHQDRHEIERPLGVEMFWKRELPQPDGDRAWSMISEEARERMPKMHLIGFIDYVYYDTRRRMVVIRDDKAQKSLSNATSAIDDLMDSQLMLYAWGISPKLKRLGVDAPRAVSYDRTCSVAPRTPVLTAAGGLSKSITAYDAETYRRWAMTDERPGPEEVARLEVEHGFVEGGLQKVLDRMEPGPVWGKVGEVYASGAKKGQPKFGTYQLDPKVLEKLQHPLEQSRWVTRTFKPISAAVLRAHLRSAVDTALDIFQTQMRAQQTGEAARNLDRRGCAQCDFADLCRAQLIGGAQGEYDLASLGLRVKPSRPRTKRQENEDATADAGSTSAD